MVSEFLSYDQRFELKYLLFQYNKVFSNGEFDIGKLKNISHRIINNQTTPVIKNIYRVLSKICEETTK